jgi:hypothetical protein
MYTTPKKKELYKERGTCPDLRTLPQSSDWIGLDFGPGDIPEIPRICHNFRFLYI